MDDLREYKNRVTAAVQGFMAKHSKRRKKPKPEPTPSERVGRQIKAFKLLGNIDRCRNALQWCRDNPAKQKTHRGMSKFLGGLDKTSK